MEHGQFLFIKLLPVNDLRLITNGHMVTVWLGGLQGDGHLLTLSFQHFNGPLWITMRRVLIVAVVCVRA